MMIWKSASGKHVVARRQWSWCVGMRIGMFWFMRRWVEYRVDFNLCISLLGWDLMSVKDTLLQCKEWKCEGVRMQKALNISCNVQSESTGHNKKKYYGIVTFSSVYRTLQTTPPTSRWTTLQNTQGALIDGSEELVYAGAMLPAPSPIMLGSQKIQEGHPPTWVT